VILSLNLHTLKYRRHNGDTIELFKVIKGIYDPMCVPHFDLIQLNYQKTPLGLGVISAKLLKTTVIMIFKEI